MKHRHDGAALTGTIAFNEHHRSRGEPLHREGAEVMSVGRVVDDHEPERPEFRDGHVEVSDLTERLCVSGPKIARQSVESVCVECLTPFYGNDEPIIVGGSERRRHRSEPSPVVESCSLRVALRPPHDADEGEFRSDLFRSRHRPEPTEDGGGRFAHAVRFLPSNHGQSG